MLSVRPNEAACERAKYINKNVRRGGAGSHSEERGGGGGGGGGHKSL